MQPRYQLRDVTEQLVAVAMGRQPAQLVIRGGRLVNVNTGEIQEAMDVAISHGRIALVGDASRAIGEQTIVIGALGNYLVPGFMDGHIHVESSMITVREFSRAVVPHGTTAIFMDPHEIANVLGLPGIRLMIEEGRQVPLRVYTAMPSCVPAAPGFEDTGASIGATEIQQAMTWEEVVNLGEMMNSPGETGSGLNAYVASGVRSIREHRIDTRFATLVRDDTHPHKLIAEGHLDHIVRRAIEEGVAPITAIQMVTINVAECFGLARDLGSVSPGKWADLLLLSDLSRVQVEQVLINGELVAKAGQMLVETPEFLYPALARQSVHLVSPLMAVDFAIRPITQAATGVMVRVMQIMEAQVGTLAKQAVLPVVDGFVQTDQVQDVAKVAVVERHHRSGSYGLGFVQGFGLQGGAVASTVAHDSHNLLIVGTNDDDMALAGNTLAEVSGGMVAVRDGQVLALLPLPIAGLMSDRPLEQVAQAVECLDEAWKSLGCQLVSPFMTMTLLACTVLPELRLTNRGLVDTVNFQFVDLITAERMAQVKI